MQSLRDVSVASAVTVSDGCLLMVASGQRAELYRERMKEIHELEFLILAIAQLLQRSTRRDSRSTFTPIDLFSERRAAIVLLVANSQSQAELSRQRLEVLLAK